MRVLFISWAWPSHFYPMVPLAWAMRSAGHEVLVATQPAMTEAAVRTGLPVALVGRSDDTLSEIRRIGGPQKEDNRFRSWTDLRRFRSLNAQLYVRLAEDMIPATRALAAEWRPDMVVFEPTTYAGPVVAAELGVPAVRHLWGVDFPYLLREFDDEALAPLRARFDLDPVETLGVATVDVCPERMQVPPSPHVPMAVRRLRARYTPYNGPAVMPRWLLTPPERPRICVTGGTSWVHVPHPSQTGRIIRAAATLDVEVVAAVTAEAAAQMGPMPDNVRFARSLPLHLLLPTCVAYSSQGGMGSIMTAVTCGLPQLAAPLVADQRLNAERLVSTGAARMVLPHEADAETIRSHLSALLSDPAHREAAATLRAESQAQAPLSEVVEELASLPRPGRARRGAAVAGGRERAPRSAGPNGKALAPAVAAGEAPDPAVATGKVPEPAVMAGEAFEIAAAAREAPAPAVNAGEAFEAAVGAGPGSPPARRGSRAGTSRPARGLRVLFTPAYGGPVPARALVAAAWAFRVAGHEVRFAATPAIERAVAAAGLAAVPVGEGVDMDAALRAQLPSAQDCAALVTTQFHKGYGPAMYVAEELAEGEEGATPWALAYRDALLASVAAALRVADTAIAGTVEFARRWRPDLVVFGPRGYAGPLVARLCGVPAVRHLPGMDFGWLTEAVEAAALEPLWARYGLTGPDMSGTVTIDPCPSALRAHDGSPRLPVRFVPHSGAPGPLPAPRGRVCVAMGAESWWLPEQRAVAGLVTAALDDAAPASVSLAEALRGSDVLVTAGDDASLLTAVMAGVPAVVLPQLPEHAWRAQQYVATGAGLAIPPAELTPDAVRDAVARLRSDTGHRPPLRHMRAELEERPTYQDLVAELPGLLGVG
ncbi:nucleotide disphospho-sugar-binding domain-containing protein [Sphaerisporangium dianthi]|uniref:Nucleotide disphospho-sugar-binding domain-containing protein n=1 Tax=Sphaerisporangium dianthi TaxID=1436120 RepID=A0ABV9CJK0_9ACTN